MRKYDKRNKMYMLMVMISSIILIIIFSFFINKVITNGKLVYEIDAGSIMYDKDKNLIKIDEDATLKIKWNDMYYLMYKDDVYLLGKNAIIYNPAKSQMNLYGKYYEVTSQGEDKVIIHEDETLVSTNESKFYKIEDRKYLLIDNTIKTENNELNTNNYLIVELDKQGNALIYNNSVNLKTFKETSIITSTYTFNIAEELLYIDNEEVNLKKIIGSTNEYVKEEENNNDKEDNKDNNNDNNKDNNNTTNNDNKNNNDDNKNNNQNNNNDKDNTLTDDEKNNIISATKTTSIISIVPSVGYINVDYVVYDPLDEYSSIYVEIYDSNNKLVSVSYFDKSANSVVIPNLRANVSYNLIFKYSYYKDNKLVEEKFDEAKVMMGTPSLSLKVSKVTPSRVYYTLYLDKDYELDSLKVNLNSKLDDKNINLTNTIDKSTLSNKDKIEGYFESDEWGNYVTIYLSDVRYKDYLLNVDVSYKIEK